MQSLGNFQKIEIGIVFDFPETTSKITKKFCTFHKGTIPVYASSKDENSTLGFIQDNLKGVKYYENCLSWNRNGSVGYVFIRNHKFSTNEDHRTLIIKDRYKSGLDPLYLKFEIERQLFLTGFSYLNKCGVDKIKEVGILIPVKENGEFDLEQQRSIANKYNKIKELKADLGNSFETIINLKVDMSSIDETKSILMTELFDPKKGDAKYTKKYIHDHMGEYPVYSSQTSSAGEIGKIDTYDYEEECFTWTTDGIWAGTVFYRNGKFSITTHCGILKLKEKYNKKVDFEYLLFVLNQTLPKNTLGEWANKRLGIRRMGEISIEIPIKENGEFDLSKQKDIAEKYKKIEQIKKHLEDNYERIINSKVQIVKTEDQ